MVIIFECEAYSHNSSQLLPAEGHLYITDLEIKWVEGWVELTVKYCPAHVNIKCYNIDTISAIHQFLKRLLR
jgi:hypothetical protein